MSESEQSLSPAQAEAICRAAKERADASCQQAAATAAAQSAACKSAAAALESATGQEIVSSFLGKSCSNYVIERQRRSCSKSQATAASVCEDAREEASPEETEVSAADTGQLPPPQYAAVKPAESALTLA